MWRRPARRATLVVLLGVAACSTDGGPAPAGGPAAGATAAPAVLNPVEIVSARFGVFGADPHGRRFLFETEHVPAVVTAAFGWYIVFRTDRPTVVWREEFELPEEPPTWGPGEALGIYQISPDRRTAVTERVIPTGIGFIANEWRYAPGDPTGAHKMRVYIDGQLVREFEFAIERGSSKESPARRRLPPGASA